MPDDREDDLKRANRLLEELLSRSQSTQSAIFDLLRRTQAIEESLRLLSRAYFHAYPMYVLEETREGKRAWHFYPNLSVAEVDRLWLMSKGEPPLVPLERETPPWRHLVARDHPWRRQLYIRGRNMTVRQLLGLMKANNLSPEDAAADLGLEPDAVFEALHYAEKSKDLLESDAAMERYILSSRGHGSGAPAVP